MTAVTLLSTVSSLVAQGDHRIESCGAPRGEETCEQRRAPQDDRHASERQRIVGAYSHQEVRYRVSDRKSQTIQYVYDALNRLTQKNYPDSTSVDY